MGCLLRRASDDHGRRSDEVTRAPLRRRHRGMGRGPDGHHRSARRDRNPARPRLRTKMSQNTRPQSAGPLPQPGWRLLAAASIGIGSGLSTASVPPELLVLGFGPAAVAILVLVLRSMKTMPDRTPAEVRTEEAAMAELDTDGREHLSQGQFAYVDEDGTAIFRSMTRATFATRWRAGTRRSSRPRGQGARAEEDLGRRPAASASTSPTMTRSPRRAKT